MKFLHLADLHLGKRVNGFDMLEDQRFILEQILTLCEKHGVEAVVIAGDIYDTPVPPAAACTLLDWFLTQLAARRIPVLAVSGNHDSAERLDFASSLLAEQNVHIAGRFTGCPKQVVLNDRHGPIEFTLLPFVRAATVRHYLPDADITSREAWAAVGVTLAKTALTTAASWVMRAKLDASALPTPLPPADPGTGGGDAGLPTTQTAPDRRRRTCRTWVRCRIRRRRGSGCRRPESGHRAG